MKCINMKIAEILFFIANFMTINSSVVRETKAITVTNEENLKKKLMEDCPRLMKKISDKNLTDYTVNCKMSATKSPEELVLQDACFVVRNMFMDVCNKNLSETNLDLLGRDNTTNICPFHFHHLKHSVFKSYENVKKLEEEDYCKSVCYVLYSTKDQCILLSKFNDYFRIRATSARLEADEPVDSPSIANSGIQKTSETLVRQPSEEQHLSVNDPAKENVTQTKTETIGSKLTKSMEKVNKILKMENKTEKKTEKPVMTSTSKGVLKQTEKMEAPKGDQKVIESNIDEPISKNDDDKLTEEELTNEDNLQSSDYLPFNQELKEKDSYVGEGSSQPEDSHFFFYFIMVSSVVVVGYLAFHNKNKILAYALEGSSGRRSRRRPNPARYRKLETNLEEAISSSASNTATSSVVY